MKKDQTEKRALQETLQLSRPGPLTTVQDLGRTGYGRHGIPPSGAADPFSLRIGNLLVGNDEGEASLEVTLMDFKASFLTPAAVAVTGGDLRPSLNGSPLAMWRTHRVERGDVLAMAGPRSGLRSYLAVGGGIAVPRLLGSRSTNLAACFGGFRGRPLMKGDILQVVSPENHLAHAGTFCEPTLVPRWENARRIRVMLGPHHRDFPGREIETFLNSAYRVTSHSDRTGLRLAGPPLSTKADRDASIISEGLVPGSIQVPGDGQPILLLAETVTGGYRKIATVIQADLFRLGQMKPGDRVRFDAVSRKEAIRLYSQKEAAIRRMIRKRPVDP